MQDIPTDPELLAAARGGDAHAFRLLVERYEQAVAATVAGMLGRGDEAEDVGQEVFIQLFRSLDRYRGEAALGTYLRRIAINLSLNALKRRRRLAWRFPSRDQDREPLPEPATDPDAADAWETREHVRAAIMRLAPAHRAVVVLRMVDGCSTREAAQILQIPEGTVMSRLSRAMKELERHLTPYRRDNSSGQEGG
ncbi:MAG TPA: RNA polymerase sigma factor [Longimicrobium sp.]|jgi:RNA polymerase sigma-70 factor (ECF subfamily)|uniref:RNA polymerase sigma factor n=1 Tax=Longimicrobium sp. TaxID=2029185 RepID=UPI002ED8BDD5